MKLYRLMEHALLHDGIAGSFKLKVTLAAKAKRNVAER